MQAEARIHRDASIVLRLHPSHAVGTAICLDAILGEVDDLGDGCVTTSILTHGRNSLALLICHALSSCLRTSVLKAQWKIPGCLDETAKIKKPQLD